MLGPAVHTCRSCDRQCADDLCSMCGELVEPRQIPASERTLPMSTPMPESTRQGATVTNTYSDVMTRHDVEIPAHLAADMEIPVLTGLQVQGDVAIIPRRPGRTANPTRVPVNGIPVVRGEAGGNTHLLVADGRVTWSAMQRNAGQGLGTVDVPDGSTAYILHPEHGANAMGPGTYELRRQREQADEIRLVAD